MGITVLELMKMCQEAINAGNGDKTILISRDDEGNGYHTLYQGFESNQEALNLLHSWGYFDDNNDPQTVILLG